MRWFVVVTLFVLANCAGDLPPDDPAQRPCVGATYDPCFDEHTCERFNCRPFVADGFQICTQSCDADNPCPGESDGAICDETAGPGLGVCKPVEPNVCKVQ